LSPVCAGIKRDGGRCTQGVKPGETWCYNHDPAHVEKRRRQASKAGKGKPSREIKDLKKQLEDLANDVLEHRVGSGVATIVNQIINTRARLIELERKIREQAELEERLAALEQAQGGASVGELEGPDSQAGKTERGTRHPRNFAAGKWTLGARMASSPGSRTSHASRAGRLGAAHRRRR
jgi:hypothetical protein